MPWQIVVTFPAERGDEINAFTHRVGNLKEEVSSGLQKLGVGSIPFDELDRVGYAFNAVVPRRRDVKMAMKLVRDLVVSHIPERAPAIDTIQE